MRSFMTLRKLRLLLGVLAAGLSVLVYALKLRHELMLAPSSGAGAPVAPTPHKTVYTLTVSREFRTDGKR